MSGDIRSVAPSTCVADGAQMAAMCAELCDLAANCREEAKTLVGGMRKRLLAAADGYEKWAEQVEGLQRGFDAWMYEAGRQAEAARLLRVAVQNLRTQNERLISALREIESLEPQPYAYPADWSEQIAACPDCERYKGHPIQNGICDTHRRPIWDREKHDDHEEKVVGYRAKRIAHDAIYEALGSSAATSNTQEDGATPQTSKDQQVSS